MLTKTYFYIKMLYMFKSLFEYYKTYSELTIWTIIIFAVCLAVGVAAVFLRKWLVAKQEQKNIEEVPCLEPTEHDGTEVSSDENTTSGEQTENE